MRWVAPWDFECTLCRFSLDPDSLVREVKERFLPTGLLQAI